MTRLFIVILIVGCSNVELEQVKVSDQEIHFKKYWRGLNYEVLGVSDSRIWGEPTEQNSIFCPSGRRFFYYTEGDSLVILDSNLDYEGSRFELPIKYRDLTVSEAYKIRKDILTNPSSKYRVFPESVMKHWK